MRRPCQQVTMWFGWSSFQRAWQTENYRLQYYRKGLNIDWKFVTKVTGCVEISVMKVTGRITILTGTSRLMKILTIQWATVISKSYNINHISDWNFSGSVLSTTVLFTDHQYQVQICNIRPLISGRAKNKPTTATTLKRCSVKLISETSFGNILWTFMHPIKHALTLYKR